VDNRERRHPSAFEIGGGRERRRDVGEVAGYRRGGGWEKRYPSMIDIGDGHYAMAAQILDAHRLRHGITADGLDLETQER
jgi:hypothetical protein